MSQAMSTAAHGSWRYGLVCGLLGLILGGWVAQVAALPARHPVPPVSAAPAPVPADWIDPVSLVPDPPGRPDPPLTRAELAQRLAGHRAQGSAAAGRIYCGLSSPCVREDGQVVEVVDR